MPGHHIKANLFVGSVSIAPVLIVLSLLLHYDGLPHHITLAALTLFGLSYAYFLINFTLPFINSPFTHLPQPPNTRFILGNTMDMLSRPPGWRFLTFMKTIPNDGLIYSRGIFHGPSVLLATTPAVIKQVLHDHAYDYEKLPVTRGFLRRFIGDGLITVEGSEHKLQRKAVAPAFSGKHIKDLVPLMWTKSKEFVNVIGEQTQRSGYNGVLEISKLASHVTLDIIGVACLGRDFKSLYNADDELARTYETILNPENKALQGYFALTLLLGTRLVKMIPFLPMNRVAQESEVTLRRICHQLLVEGKAAIHKDSKDFDILSVLLRSSVELDDEQLTSQLLTFLAAGHETTSSALTWTCYLLAKHQDIQSRLREEMTAYMTSEAEIMADTFDAMPLLDAITRESFRLYPTVPGTVRVATEPSTIHTTRGMVPVPAGTQVILPIWAIHRDPALWGDDVDDFRPSRWQDGTANEDPYAIVTFLHGPRSCIGQSFARSELKCLLTALVMNFKMGLVDDRIPIPLGAITIKPADGMYLRFTEVGK